MISYLHQKRIKVFLPKGTDDLAIYRKHLLGVLHAANIEAVEDVNLLSTTECSIHLLGTTYNSSNDSAISKDEYWFEQACKQINKNHLYRIFVWQPPLQNQIISPRQNAFINSIRNNLVQNMTFSSQQSPLMLVEDIRSIVYAELKTVFDTKPVDVFFIYNEIDEDFGNEIVEILSDVFTIEKLNISLNLQTDYSELISQQIEKSKLTVIYFNNTVNWALPFTEQVWKNIGGASANKKILMIGDTDYDHNKDILFNAPNVSAIHSSKELIPLETKVFYDKMFTK